LSKPRSLAPSRAVATTHTSIVRTTLAAVLVVVGIAWVVYYDRWVVKDQTPKQVADLGNWNFLIGFGLLLAGLVVAAHPSTPLGRGRGVVIGMLGCFLIGLAWIVVYYVTSQSGGIPVIDELGNYNLMVGIGFMAVGFVYATKWE
jgi:drug/metabolite transporter (DMT)-like permease